MTMEIMDDIIRKIEAAWRIYLNGIIYYDKVSEIVRDVQELLGGSSEKIRGTEFENIFPFSKWYNMCYLTKWQS